MTASFPTNLASLTNPTATDNTVTVSHSAQHANANDEIEAIQTKLGVDSSAVTSTIDYKLKNASSVNPGHKHTLAGALTDVVITNPTNGEGFTFNGTNWVNSTSTVADSSTTVKGITKLSVAPVSASIPIAVGDNDGRVPTQDENDALVGTSGTAVSASNKLVDAADVATTATASKIVRRIADGQVTVPTTPSATTDAASKAYVDAVPQIFKVGTATKDSADASTTQNIAHGLGKIPKYVKITAHSGTALPVSSTSFYAFTVYNGTTQSSVSYYRQSTTPFHVTATTFSLNTATTDSAHTDGVVTFDATNIIITWTKTGSPTGTYTLLWEAIG